MTSIVWAAPDAKPDALMGSGATAAERGLVVSAALIGTALVLGGAAAVHPGAWTWWQYVIASVIALDLLGGVVANGLNAAKRDHYGPAPLHVSAGMKLVRRPVLFTAVHAQPIVVGLVFHQGIWQLGLAWGLTWYAVTLVSVIIVRRVPLYLQRPVALTTCLLVAVASTFVGELVPPPIGMAWVPVVLALKLTLAHAVQEEPYRPMPTSKQRPA